MTAVDEVSAVDEWIISTLSDDAALTALVPAARIVEHPADQGTAHPLITVQLYAAVDVGTANGARVLIDGRWLVRGIFTDDTPLTDARAVVRRVDALLHGQDVTAAGVTLACRRVEPFKQLEVEDGVRYTHRGGVYRVQAHEAP
ncbi:MAG: DUF3168 domain-containing protein [Actinomycetota bacterium]|nr:DUF3168 domain-containing protein [Actinomycetota bacterium]